MLPVYSGAMVSARAPPTTIRVETMTCDLSCLQWHHLFTIADRKYSQRVSNWAAMSLRISSVSRPTRDYLTPLAG